LLVAFCKTNCVQSVFKQLISTKILPAFITATQNEMAPLPLPIRTATGFLLIGVTIATQITIDIVLPNPRRNARLQASSCLKVNFPASNA